MQIKLIFLITIVFLSISLGCTRTTLDMYKPKSIDEEAIIKVFKECIETIENKDRSRHLATIHDDASLMIFNAFGNTPMLSKNEYAARLQSLPKWGRDTDVTSIREIIVSGDTATIEGTLFQNSGYKWYITFVMVKENNAWSVMKATFGQDF